MMVTVVVYSSSTIDLTSALLATLSNRKSFSELCHPHDISEVNDIAHSLTDLEK